jgi:predicted nuclease of predicted toxin-antitoxin system
VRFLLDESADARLAHHLRELGHDVTTIAANYSAGMKDTEVLAISEAEERVLITNDPDFGELVFAQRQSHVGVVLIRLESGAGLEVKIARLDAALDRMSDFPKAFVVVTKHRIRIR